MSVAVTPKDILQIKSGKWIYQGRELTKGEIDNLKQEAELIAKTALWKLLVNEARYHAQRRAIIDAKTFDDLKQLQEFHRLLVLFEEFLVTIKSS